MKKLFSFLPYEGTKCSCCHYSAQLPCGTWLGKSRTQFTWT